MSGGRTRSGVFLLEFVIILLVFSLSCAVCVQLFAAAQGLRERSEEKDAAVAETSSICERLKACADADAALSGLPADGAIYYDGGWRRCEAGGAVYEIRAELAGSQLAGGSLLSGTVAAFRSDGTGEPLCEFAFAHYYYGGEAAA